MTNLQFDEETEFHRPASLEKRPFLVRLVLSTGIVSTEKQAEYVLFGFAICMFALTFFIPVLLAPNAPKMTPEDYQRALMAPGGIGITQTNR